MDADGGTPQLILEGFSGRLERLLALARAREIDLGRLSVHAIVDQLATALLQAAPLGEKADWVVMVAWLVQLRSNLLLPADEPAQLAAEAQADRLRSNLVALQQMQALAAWLDRRLQTGRDVFARGRPETLGLSMVTDHEVNVVEFLWASLALFEDDTARPDTAVVYQPRRPDLHSMAEARARILDLLAAASGGQTLDQLLPAAVDAALATGPRARLDIRHVSRWTSIFAASLELARSGVVTLAQDDDFSAIHVTPRAPPTAA